MEAVGEQDGWGGAEGGGDEFGMGGGDASAAGEAAVDGAAAASESPWVSGYNEEGYQYWFNNITGESSWYPPEGFEADGQHAAAATEEQPSAGGEFAEEPLQEAEIPAFGGQQPAEEADDGSTFFGSSGAPNAAEADISDMFGVPPPMATPMAPPPTTTTKEPPPTANDLFSPPKKGTTELFKGGTPRMGEPPPEQQPVEADPFAEPEGAGPAPTDLSGRFAQQQTTEPPPPQTEEVVAAQPEEQQTAIEGGGDEAAAAGLEESPWVVGYTEEGHQYWYNNLTGESSWYDPNVPQEGVVGGDEGGGEYAATEQQYDYSQQPQPDAQQQPQQYDLRSPFGVELPLGVQIDVSGTLSSQEALSALRDFPGPLPDGSQGYTPPALLGYAEATTQQMDGIYYNGESEPLLWRLLSLLCKHDGVLDGSTGDASASELLQALRGGEGAGGTPLTGGPADPAAQQAAALKFESLLLDGKRQAACDLAMESGMWADALLLSSHMDAETWRLVMAKFAESTLAAGSPLRTLYGLFAGNGTAVFRDGAEGNGSSEPPARMVSQWRDNLAMMLANPTAGDTEVIAHLGDEVWRHHGVAAAHCCYLLAELPPDDKRMVLVGHDHNATPSLSSSSEGWSNPTLLAVQSIQATEIYCHLRGKASADFVPPGRSPFELLYAHLLFEAGEAHKSAAYTDKLISQIDGPCGMWPHPTSSRRSAVGWPLRVSSSTALRRSRRRCRRGRRWAILAWAPMAWASLRRCRHCGRPSPYVILPLSALNPPHSRHN